MEWDSSWLRFAVDEEGTTRVFSVSKSWVCMVREV